MSIRKLRSARVNSVTANQYIGQEGDMFWDEDTGTLRVSDGHTPGGYYPVLTAPIAAFGDFTAVTNTLSTINNNESINLVTQGTGALNLYGGGGLNIHTDGTGSNVAMSVLPTGVTNIFSPTVSNTTNAVTINGTSTNQLRPTVFRGTMLNVTGNDNQINTVTLDAIGTFTSANTGVTSTFARIVGRAGRGTITTPTALQTNDEMLRFTGTGYSGQPSLSGYTVGAAIRFLASENYTPTAAGSRIEFSANPIGSITPGGMGTLMLTVDGQGISTPGNLTANGTATLNGTTNFVGPTNFYGLITSYGNRISNGDSIFNGNLTVANGLTVEGNTTHQGNLVINGNAIVSNQVIITGDGVLVFNDGSVQTTAAIKIIDNLDHITGAISQVGINRQLALSSDATPVNTPGTIVSRDSNGNIAVGGITASSINTTAITGNSTIAGSMVIAGNLLVQGTTTSVNSAAVSVGTKTITVSNTAITGSQAEGSAFLVGNDGQFADLTFDNGQNAWRSNVSIVPAVTLATNLGSETRQWNTVFANIGNFDTQIQVGPTAVIFQNSPGQFGGNVNSWTQVTNQNTSNGNTASTDFVASADDGNDVINYIDMGINSSGYNSPDYSIQYALDGYLFTNGGNLTIGTQSTQKALVFFTGGTTADKEAGRIEGSGQRWLIAKPVDDGVSKFQVNGNVAATWFNGKVAYTNIQNVPNFALTSYVDAVTTAWTANAASQQITINTNTTNISTLQTTATSLQNQITGANAAIVTANTAMKGYVDGQISSVTTAWTANAATQAGLISTSATNITTLQGQVYTNANVAAYLPTYTGNVGAGNVNVTSNVHAAYYFGDGSNLTNLTVAPTQTVAPFTPTLASTGGGSFTYSTQSGYSIKSGRSVSVFFTIAITGATGVSGTVYINNLPYTSMNTGSANAGGGALDNYSFTALPTHVTGIVNSNSTRMDFYWHDRSGSVNTMGLMTTTNLGTSATLTGRITYISAT